MNDNRDGHHHAVLNATGLYELSGLLFDGIAHLLHFRIFLELLQEHVVGGAVAVLGGKRSRQQQQRQEYE